MADQVKMRITRRYPRGGTTYGIGAVITVPEHVAKSMETARPPFGVRIGADSGPGRTQAGAGAASTKPTSS